MLCKWCYKVLEENELSVAIYNPTVTAEERRRSGPMYWMHSKCVFEAIIEAVELVPEPGRR